MMTLSPCRLLLAASLLLLPAAHGGEEPSPISPTQQQADAALGRAQEHLGEAFKALQEAGSLLYQDKMPSLREQSHRMLEGLLGEAEKMMQELQKQLPKGLPDQPGTAPPPTLQPPMPGTPQSPPTGNRERFI